MPDTTETAETAETAEPEAPTRADQLRDLALRWWPGWRDVACVIFLITATFHLVFNDGGRPFRPLLPLLALGVLAIVATLPTLAAAPRWLRLLALAWVAGPLLALAFADVRAGWVRPVAAWAIAVPAALATLHVLRRRWGAAAIAAIVGLALTLSWFEGLLLWWGGGTSRGEPAWLALSWHNQSGTLMAVLGVGGLGVALARTGWQRVIGVIAAVAGLSAAWLSGSRGAVLTAAAAVVVMLVIAARRPRDEVADTVDAQEGSQRASDAARTFHPAQATAIVAAVVAVLSVVAVLGLASLWAEANPARAGEADGPRGIAAQPITAREQDAAGNLRARVGHWEAAVRMFATSPVTGTGPGSYHWSSRQVYPDDTNLTSSAHGEQVEALGELGLVGGGAALAVTFGLAWLVLGALWKPGRHPLEVAAAGTATLLASHAALDFDWDYPILLALFAITAATLVTARVPSSRRPLDPETPPATEAPTGPERPPDTGDDTPAATKTGLPDMSTGETALTTLTAIVAIALIVAGTTGIVLQLRGTTPWALDGHIRGAVASAAEGDPRAANDHLDAIRTWNPGAPRLDDVTALTTHALGDLPDEDLAATIDPERSAFADQLQAATQLLHAERPQLALRIVEDARPVIDRRRAWGVTNRVAHASAIELTSRHRLGGCDDVAAAWPDLHTWLEGHGIDPDALLEDPTASPDEGEPAADRPETWRDCQLTTPRDG